MLFLKMDKNNSHLEKSAKLLSSKRFTKLRIFESQ